MKVWDEQVRTEARSQRDELVKMGVSKNNLASILERFDAPFVWLPLFVSVGNLTILERLLFLPPVESLFNAPPQLPSFSQHGSACSAVVADAPPQICLTCRRQISRWRWACKDEGGRVGKGGWAVCVLKPSQRSQELLQPQGIWWICSLSFSFHML